MENVDLYLEIINNLRDGVYLVDTERRITLWNDSAEEITGFKKEEVLNKCCHDNLFNHINKEGLQLCVSGCPLHATIIDGNTRKKQIFLRHKEGHRVPVSVNIFPIRENGKIIGAVEIFSQNSPTVYDDNLVEQLSNLAMQDQLTGLPNRRKIESYLNFRFKELNWVDSRFCVIFADLDNFSKLNNSYGHDAGDEMLKNVSKSIMHVVRSSDLFGRWGGEEFIGLFSIKEKYDAVLIAEKIRILISKTEIVHEGESISVTASLGVTIAEKNDTIDSVVKRADALMYESKQKGKNCVTSDAG